RTFLVLHVKNYDTDLSKKIFSNKQIWTTIAQKEYTKRIYDFINGLELDIDLMSSILFMNKQEIISIFMPYREVLFRIHNNLIILVCEKNSTLIKRAYVKAENEWMPIANSENEVSNFEEFMEDLFLACLHFLISKECKREYWPEKIEDLEKLNKSRKAKGKTLIEQSVIVKLNPIRQEPVDLGGTHASPRTHWRRGYVRKHNGYYVKVRPAIVNYNPLVDLEPDFPDYKA